ncbi:MAG: response regulator transcription factor [Clostridia bacterium]|nr:response regulator transcription factor [Clostridia bacterium]
MEDPKLIYIADDEANIRDAIRAFLEAEGYRVRAFASGEELMAGFAQESCDLIILDVMMPGMSGFDVCTKIRETSTVPIIMLTARDADIDYATGLSLGSDDYFTKPFSAMSLVMRIRAIFRRIEFERGSGSSKAGSEVSFGPVTLDPKTKAATGKAGPIDLTPNEFALLHFLVEHGGEAVSREDLLNKIWGYNSAVETRVADDTVRRLRKKLTGSGIAVETVWGFGFQLREAE